MILMNCMAFFAVIGFAHSGNSWFAQTGFQSVQHSEGGQVS